MATKNRSARRKLVNAFSSLLALICLPALAAPAQASSGTWDRTWGKDVAMGGGTGFEICTVAPSCQAASTATALGGELDSPWGAATDAAGNVYVSDGHDRIQKFDSAGNFLRTWGTDVIDPADPGDTGTGFEICVAGVNTCKEAAASTGLGGEMRFPGGLATDAAGNVYVSDGDNNRIQKFDSAGNFLRTWGRDVIDPTSPGNTGTGFEICVNGVDTCKAGIAGGLAGEMDAPQGVASDTAGNLYVADDGNQRIDKYDSAGNFQRAWGKDVTATGSPDDTGTGFEICSLPDGDTCQPGTFGGGLGGEFAVPRGLGTDSAGNVYVADANNHRIQAFDAAGSFLRTWGRDVIDPTSPGNTGTGFEICVNGANTCKAGIAGGLGGEFDRPYGAATDAAGNVYVTDRFNSRIQRFDTSGNFQRAWGEDVAAAGPGDTGTGFEICVAANGDSCKTGTHVAPAQGGELNLPPGLATDTAGNLYVADADNDRVQKFADPVVPPPAAAPSTVTGRRAAALKKCKKKRGKARKKCKKKANRLPV